MPEPYTKAELDDLLARDVTPDQPRLTATIAGLLPEPEEEEPEGEGEGEETAEGAGEKKPAAKRALAKKK